LRLYRAIRFKTLQRYWRLQRGLTMGAQALVLGEANRVLLIRHGYQDGWYFPGGGVEKGETVRDAMARELREETGVVAAGQPPLFGLYANFSSFPGDHIALFVVRDWAQPNIPAANWEVKEQAFFAPDALPASAVGSVRRRLGEVLNNMPGSEHW
jgi:8-oxo-dGTP pyrophosphatase MutT (NUDIX family)